MRARAVAGYEVRVGLRRGFRLLSHAGRGRSLRLPTWPPVAGSEYFSGEVSAFFGTRRGRIIWKVRILPSIRRYTRCRISSEVGAGTHLRTKVLTSETPVLTSPEKYSLLVVSAPAPGDSDGANVHLEIPSAVPDVVPSAVPSAVPGAVPGTKEARKDGGSGSRRPAPARTPARFHGITAGGTWRARPRRQ